MRPNDRLMASTLKPKRDQNLDWPTDFDKLKKKHALAVLKKSLWHLSPIVHLVLGPCRGAVGLRRSASTECSPDRSWKSNSANGEFPTKMRRFVHSAR